MSFLPLFPLQMIAYPGEQVNLHIFEPRYKQLINEVDAQGTTFGLPAYIGKKLMEFGTEMELLEIVNRKPSGEMDIKTRGVGIFRINEFFTVAPHKLYPGGEIETMNFSEQGEYLSAEHVIEKIKEMHSVLNVKKEFNTDPATFLSFNVAHYIGLSANQEYALLTMPDEEERRKFLLDHLNEVIPVVSRIEETRKRIKLNGHFKNFNPLDFK